MKIEYIVYTLILFELGCMAEIGADINLVDLVGLSQSNQQNLATTSVLLQWPESKNNPLPRGLVNNLSSLHSNEVKKNVGRSIAGEISCSNPTQAASPEAIKNIFTLVMGYESSQSRVDELATLLRSISNPDALYPGDTAISGGEGMTALMWAIDRGHRDFVEVLIQRGADINKQDVNKGWAPLHFAAVRGELDIAKRLIDQGALKSTKNNARATPYDIAKINGRKNMLELLKV